MRDFHFPTKSWVAVEVAAPLPEICRAGIDACVANTRRDGEAALDKAEKLAAVKGTEDEFAGSGKFVGVS